MTTRPGAIQNRPCPRGGPGRAARRAGTADDDRRRGPERAGAAVWCGGELTAREAARLRRLTEKAGIEGEHSAGDDVGHVDSAGWDKPQASACRRRRDRSGARDGAGVWVTGRRLDAAGPAVLGPALGDPDVVAQYAAKVVTVPGSECAWWTGAVSGRAAGRPGIAGLLLLIGALFYLQPRWQRQWHRRLLHEATG